MSDTLDQWKEEARAENDAAVEAMSEIGHRWYVGPNGHLHIHDIGDPDGNCTLAAQPGDRERRDVRPDWSDLSHVVRLVNRDDPDRSPRTIAAFARESLATQYARLMGGEENGYRVEEVAP